MWRTSVKWPGTPSQAEKVRVLTSGLEIADRQRSSYGRAGKTKQGQAVVLQPQLWEVGW